MEQIIRSLKSGVHFILAGCFALVPLVVWMRLYEPFSPIKGLVFVCGVGLGAMLTASVCLLSETCSLARTRLTLAVTLYYSCHLLLFFLLPYTDRNAFLLLSCQTLLFFLFSTIMDRRGRDLILHALMIAAVISAIYGVAQFFGFDLLHFSQGFVSRVSFGERIYITFGNPVLVGSFCVVLLPLAGAFLLRGLRRSSAPQRWAAPPWFWVGVVTLTLAMLLMSQTRSAWLAAGCSALLFGLLLKRPGLLTLLRRHPLILILLLLILSALLLSMFSGLFSPAAFMNPAGLQERLHYFDTAWNMIRDRPLFGRGIGTFAVYYPLYDDKRQVTARFGPGLAKKRLYHAHNEHLEQLHDGGIIGYALWLWILMEAALRLLRTRRIIEAGLLAALVGLLVDGLLSPSLRFLMISCLFWLIIGCANITNSPEPEPLPAPPASKKRSRKKKSAPAQSQATSIRLTPVRVIGLLGIIALLIFPISLAVRIVQANFSMKLAMYYYERQRYVPAIDQFIAVITRDPSEKPALYRLGDSYRASGHLQQAIETYTRLTRIDPNFAQVNFRLAELYDMQQDEQQVKYYLERQVRVNTMDWKAYYNLATIELQARNTAQTIEYLEQIEAIHRIQPLNPQYWQQIQTTLKTLKKT